MMIVEEAELLTHHGNSGRSYKSQAGFPQDISFGHALQLKRLPVVLGLEISHFVPSPELQCFWVQITQ